MVKWYDSILFSNDWGWLILSVREVLGGSENSELWFFLHFMFFFRRGQQGDHLFSCSMDCTPEDGAKPGWFFMWKVRCTITRRIQVRVKYGSGRIDGSAIVSSVKARSRVILQRLHTIDRAPSQPVHNNNKVCPSFHQCNLLNAQHRKQNQPLFFLNSSQFYKYGHSQTDHIILFKQCIGAL